MFLECDLTPSRIEAHAALKLRRMKISQRAVPDNPINLRKSAGVRFTPAKPRPAVIRRKPIPLYTPGDLNSRLIDIVAQEYDFLAIDIKSPSQKPKYTEARQVAMFLLQRFTGKDATEIASKIGRSRKIAIRAFNMIRKRLDNDTKFAGKLDFICARLQDELKLTVQHEPPKVISNNPNLIHKIIEYVSQEFEIDPVDILRPLREFRYVRPRQIVCYLIRELTSNSYPEIGRQLKRDHSTGVAAVARIKKIMFDDAVFCQQVAELELGFSGWLSAKGDCVPP